MNDKTRVTLVKAGAIISLIEGILMCVTIIGAVIGIFDIIAYSKLKKVYNCPTEEASKRICNSEGFGWSIYVLISCFPLGLISFLPYVLTNESSSSSNNSSDEQ